DKLEGEAGKDVLIGGNGRDEFHFGKKDGSDVIKDFDPNGDKIDVSAIKSIKKFSDIDLDKRGSDTLVDLGKTEVLLEDIAPRDLGAGDFLF
ncbi:MAG: calcium-binding protein, partial [Pseudomonadota bacterium]